jgi:hypothetical protein
MEADVIKAKSGAVRTVKDSNGVSVWYRVDIGGLSCDFGCLVEEWRIEAKDAEVLHVAS